MKGSRLSATLSFCAIFVLVRSGEGGPRLSCDGLMWYVNVMYEVKTTEFQGTFRLSFTDSLIFVSNDTVLLHPWLDPKSTHAEINFTRSQKDFALELAQKFGDPSVVGIYYFCDLSVSCSVLCTSETRSVWKSKEKAVFGEESLRRECEEGHGLEMLRRDATGLKSRWEGFCRNVSDYAKTKTPSVFLEYDADANAVVCAFYTVLSASCVLHFEGLGAGLETVLCVQYRNLTVGARYSGAVTVPLPVNVSCWVVSGVFQTEVARLEVREAEPEPTPAILEHHGRIGTIAGTVVSLLSLAVAVVVCVFRRKLGLTCLNGLADRARYRLVRAR